MKILVIGAGGREHALCWKLAQTEGVKVFAAPGNPGIARVGKCVAGSPLEAALETGADLTVVGPEAPLVAGTVDLFRARGLAIVGPAQEAAQLEGSKIFAKNFMMKRKIPTAGFVAVENAVEARAALDRFGFPVVLKADGLAAGKGVVIAHDRAEAEAALATLTGKLVIEEFLQGPEVSFIALCDGKNVVPLAATQDHKAVFDGDRGPNTGGMGAYTPVPHFGLALEARVMNEVVMPTLGAMRARGTPLRGVMFVGLMIDGERLNVLEYNVRFGDPECEPLMMRFEGDLAQTLLACAEGRLKDVTVRLSPRAAAAVVLASGGYPGSYRKGVPISGLERIDGAEPSEAKVRWALQKTRVKVFHAGTALRDGRLVSDGGRVLVVTAMAADLRRAVAASYEAAAMIEFEGMHMRRDIAHRALERLAP